MKINRRTFLTTSTLLATALGGCSSEGSSTDAATSGSSPTADTETPTPAETVTASPTPTRIEPARRFLGGFQQDISRLELEIRTLELDMPVVSLQYDTTYSEYQDVSNQIGRVSGFFFKQVRDGWEVARLNAEAHVRNGPVFTWHAKTEWYEMYAADEITADELSFKVLDTASREDG